MKDDAANLLSSDTQAGGMQPVSSDNVKQSYQPLVPGEVLIKKEPYDPNKYRWAESTKSPDAPPFYGKYFRGSAQDWSPQTIQGENQPGIWKFTNGLVGNTVGALTKSIGMAGEVAGGAWDLLTSFDTATVERRKEQYGTAFPHLFENFITKGMKYAEEELIEKKLLPVYESQKYQSDNLWTKMGDMKFWSSDVADGIAFAAAALFTTKGFGTAAKAMKMTKMVKNADGIMEAVLSAQGKLFQTIGATLANTIGEAAYEGADNLRTSRDALAGKEYGKLYEELGDTEKRDINQKVGPYAANVFNSNAALLLIPNLIQSRFFIGPVKDSSQHIMKAVKAGTLKANDLNTLRRTLKLGSVGVVSEGLWEEGIQNAVQNYETSKAEGSAFLDRLPGYGYEWLKGWYTTEGQESMLIGAMIGGGMGSARGIIDSKNDQQLARVYKSAYDKMINGTMAVADNVLIDFKHPYKMFESVVKDKEGKDTKINSIINPKTGKPEVDIDKFIKIIQADVFNKEVTNNLLMSALNNDKVSEKFFLNMALAQYFYRYASSDMFDNSQEALDFMLERGKIDELANDEDMKALGMDFDYMKNRLIAMKTEWDMANEKLISKQDMDDDSDSYKKFREQVDKADFYNRVKIGWLDEVDNLVDNKEQLNVLREDANSALSMLENKSERSNLYKEYIKKQEDVNNLTKQYNEEKKKDPNSLETKKYKYLIEEEEKIYGKNKLHDVLTITSRPTEQTGQLGLKNQHYFNLAADSIVGVKLETAMAGSTTPGSHTDLLDVVNILSAEITPSAIDTGKLDINQSDLDKIDKIIPEIERNLKAYQDHINSLNQGIAEKAEEDFNETQDQNVYAAAEKEIEENNKALQSKLDRHGNALEKLTDIKSQMVDIPGGKGLLNYRNNVKKAEKSDDIFLRNVAEIPVKDTEDALEIASNTKNYSNYPKIQKLLDSLYEIKELYTKTNLKDRLDRPAFKGYIDQVDAAIKKIEGSFIEKVKNEYDKDKSFDKINQKGTNSKKFKSIGFSIETGTVSDPDLFNKIGEIIGIPVLNKIIEDAKKPAEVGEEYEYHEVFVDKIIALVKEELSKNKDKRDNFMLFIKNKYERSLDEFETAYEPIKSEIDTGKYLHRHRINPRGTFSNILESSIGYPEEESEKRSATEQYLLDNDINQYQINLQSESNTGYPNLNKDVILNLIDKQIINEALQDLIDDFESNYSIVDQINAENEYFAESKTAPTNQQIHAIRQISRWYNKATPKYTEYGNEKDTINWYKRWAFVKGNAGTGKTQVVIRYILRVLGIKPAEVQFIAPHEIASEMLKKQALSISEPIISKDLKSINEKVKVVIIDEVAAFTDSQLGSIAKQLYEINQERKDKFRVIVLGDPSQVQAREANAKLSFDPEINKIRLPGFEDIYKTDPLTIKFRSIITEINEFLDMFENNKRNIKGITVYASRDTSYTGKDSIGIHAGNLSTMDHMLEKHKANDRKKIIVVSDQKKKAEFIASNPEYTDKVFTFIEIAGTEVDEVYVHFKEDEFLDTAEYNAALYTAASRAKQYIFINNELNEFKVASRPAMHDKYYGNPEKGIGKVYQEEFNKVIQERGEKYKERLEFELFVLGKGELKSAKRKDPVTKKTVKVDTTVKDNIDDVFEDTPTADAATNEEDSVDNINEATIKVADRGNFIHKVRYATGIGVNRIKPDNPDKPSLELKLHKESKVFYYATKNISDAPGDYTIHILADAYKADGTIMEDVFIHLCIVSNEELDGELSFLKEKADTLFKEQRLGLITNWQKGTTKIRNKKSEIGDYTLAVGNINTASPLSYKYDQKSTISGSGFIDQILTLFKNRLIKGGKDDVPVPYIKIFTQKELASPAYRSIADKNLDAGIPYLIINRKKDSGGFQKSQFIRLDPANLSGDSDIVVKIRAYYDKLVEIVAITNKYEGGTLGDLKFNDMVHWFSRYYQIEGDDVKQYKDPEYNEYNQKKDQYNLGLSKEDFNKISLLMPDIISGFYGKGVVRKRVASEQDMRDQGYKDDDTVKYKFEKSQSEDESGFVLKLDTTDPNGKWQSEMTTALVPGMGEIQKQLNILAKANEYVNGKRIRVTRSKQRNTIGEGGKRYITSAKSLFSTTNSNAGYFMHIRNEIKEYGIDEMVTEDNILAKLYFLQEKGITEDQLKEAFDQHYTGPITLDTLRDIIDVNEDGVHKSLRTPLPMYQINKWGAEIDKYKDELESVLQTSLTDIIPTSLSVEIEGQKKGPEKPIIEKKKFIEDEHLTRSRQRRANSRMAQEQKRNEKKLLIDDLSEVYLGRSVSQRKIKQIIKQSIPDIENDEIVFLEKHKIDEMAGTPAWGIFKDGVIYLAKDKDGNVKENIARHEVFHKIWNEFLTQEERDKFIELAKKEFPNYHTEVKSIYDGYEIEEFIAQKYHQWNRGKLTVSGWIKTLFNKIKHLLGIYEANIDTIEDIFYNVKYGLFNRRINKADNVNRLLKDVIKKFGYLDTYLNAIEEVHDRLRTMRLKGSKDGIMLTHKEMAGILKKEFIDLVDSLKDEEDVQSKLDAKYYTAIVDNYDDLLEDIYPNFNNFEGGEYISTLTEDIKAEALKEHKDTLSGQITDSVHHNTEADVTSEVKEILSYIKVIDPKTEEVDENSTLLSWRYVYVKMLSMLGNLSLEQDSSTDLKRLRDQLNESLKSKDLTLNERSILKYVNDILDNMIPVSIIDNAKFVTYDTFVYGEPNKVKNIKHITDREIRDNEVLFYQRQYGESSIDFANRVSRETGLEISKIAELSKAQYYNNIWTKLVNQFNSHRQRDPKIGERLMSYGAYKIRYINARGNAVINGISDNIANMIGAYITDEDKLKKLINNIAAWDKTYKNNPLDFVKAFLREVKLDVYANNMRDFNVKLLRQDILNVFSAGGELSQRLGKPYVANEDVTNEKDNQLSELETDNVNELTAEEILQTWERPFLNNLSEAISLIDDLSRILSSTDANNNKRYNAVLSSQGHRNIFNLINAFHNGIGIPSLSRLSKFNGKFFKRNIFVDGTNNIYRLIDDDGFSYDTAYGNRYPVQYRNEKREDHNFRNFVLGFLTNVIHSPNEIPKYIQFIAPNERKTPFGIEIDVLDRKRLIKSIKLSIQQIQEKIEAYEKSNLSIDNYGKNPYLGFEILPEVLGDRKIVSKKGDKTTVTIDKLAEEIYNALDKKSKQLTDNIIYDRMPFDGNMTNETKLNNVVDRVLYKDFKVSNMPKNDGGFLQLNETWEEFNKNPENQEKGLNSTTAFESGEERKYIIEPDHIQPLVSSYYINSYVNGYHFSQLVAGDHSSFKDFKDYIKRLSIAFAPGRNGYVHPKYGMNRYSRVAVIEDPVQSNGEVREYLKALVGDDLSEAELDDIMKAYPPDFKPGDSQGFILPERLDDINKGFGEKFGNILKGVYYHIEDNGIARAIKYSQIVLTDDISEYVDNDGNTKLTKLGVLREKMRNNRNSSGQFEPIEEVVFASGVKTGIPSIKNNFNELISEGNNIGFKPDSMFMMDNTDYRIQFNPESDIQSEISLPTQLSYIMNLYGINDARADAIYSSLSKIYQENYNSLQQWMSNRSLTDTIKEFLKHVKQDNIANLISEGIDVNFPGIVDNVLTHFLSSAFDRTVKTKFPGSKLVLQTALGSEKTFNNEGVELDKKYKRELHFKRDKFGNLYAEVIVPRKTLPSEIEKRIEEALNKNEEPDDMFFYSSVDKASVKSQDLLGYRIPSSELHSGVPMKVVGFYDAKDTNVIIAPKMLVVFHGSDFDIDSLYTVTRKNEPEYKESKGHPIGYKWDEEKGTYTFIVSEAYLDEMLASITNENYESPEKIRRKVVEAYHLNRISENILKALSDPSNLTRMITPIYIGELHNEANHINKLIGRDEKTLSVSDPIDLQEIHDIVFTGDNAVGMFMNLFKAFSLMHRAYKDKNGKTHTATRLKDDFIEKRRSDGKTAFPIKFNGKAYDELVDYTEGKYADSKTPTGERFDSLANAALDNLKEFVLPYLNVGRETIRAYSVMVMHGIPFRTINYFISQPILRYAVKFGKRDANIVRKRLESYFANSEGSLEIVELTDIESAKYLKKTPENITEILNKKDKNASDIAFLKYQLKVLSQYDLLTDIGDEVAKVSRLANTIRSWPVKVDEIEEIIEAAKHVLGIKRADKIANSSGKDSDSTFPYYMNNFFAINQHIRSALINMEWATDTVTSNFITYSERFREISDKIFKNTKIHFDRSNEKTKKKIRDEFVKYLMTSLVDVNDQTPISYQVYRKKQKPRTVYLSGPAAFNKRFVDMVKEAKNYDAIKVEKSKKDKVPYTGNIFLQSLSIRKNWWNGREKIHFNGPAMADSKDYNMYRESFQRLDSFDLMEDKDGNMKYNADGKPMYYEREPDGTYTKFQKKFVDYAALNYGMSFGLRNYTKVLPGSIYKDLSDRMILLMNSINNLDPNEIDSISEAFEAQLIQNFPEAITANILRPNGTSLKKLYTTDPVTGEKIYSGIKTIKAGKKDKVQFYFDRHFESQTVRPWPRYHIEKFNKDIVVFRRISDEDMAMEAYYIRVGHKNDDGTYMIDKYNDAITYKGDEAFKNTANAGIKIVKGLVYEGIYNNKYDDLKKGQVIYISDHNDAGAMYGKYYTIIEKLNDERYKVKEAPKTSVKEYKFYSEGSTILEKTYDALIDEISSRRASTRKWNGKIYIQKHGLEQARKFYIKINKEQFDGKQIIYEVNRGPGQIELRVNKELLGEHLYGRQLKMFAEGQEVGSEFDEVRSFIEEFMKNGDVAELKNRVSFIDDKFIDKLYNIRLKYEEKDAVEILDDIIKRGTPFHQKMARMMRDHVEKNMPYIKAGKLTSTSEKRTVGAFTRDGVITLDYLNAAILSQYVNDEQTIKYIDETILHELIHAMSTIQLEEDVEFRNQIVKWMDYIKDSHPKIAETYSYAFSDPDGKEFLEKFWSDEGFYNSLKEVKYPGDSKNVFQRMWEWIVSIFKKKGDPSMTYNMEVWLEKNLKPRQYYEKLSERTEIVNGKKVKYVTYRTNDGRIIETEDNDLEFAVYSKAKHLDNIIEQGIDWNVILDENGEQTDKYTNGARTKIYGRISDIYTGFLSHFRKSGKHETFGEREANKEWSNIPHEEKKNLNGTLMNYDEYKEYMDGLQLKTTIRGRIIHLINKMVVDRLYNNGFNEAKIKAEIQETAYKTYKITDSKGNTYDATLERDPDEFMWYERAIAKIWEKHGINTLSKIDDDLKDKIAAEVTVVSDILKYAGTVDMLIEHVDGTLSIKDIATGYNFDKYISSRLLRYGDQNLQITDSPRDRKKLQVMMYALMIKANNPDVKFRNLSVMWTPGEYHATHDDAISDVEVHDFLHMVKAFLSDKVALKEAGIDENVYSDLLKKAPKIFDVAEYTHEYRSQPKNISKNQKDILNETVDEIATSKYSADKKADLYLAKMHMIIGKAPVITDLGKNKYEDLSYEDQIILKDLSEKVLQLFRDPETALSVSEKYDVSLITGILGNYSDMPDPRIQTWKKLRDFYANQMATEIDKKKIKHDGYLQAVLDEYYKEHPLVIRNKKWMNFVNYKKLYGFMYKEWNNNGSIQLRLLHKDRPDDIDDFKKLTDAQRNYINFLNETYASYFEGENAYANQYSTYVSQNGEMVPIKMLDHYNRDLKETEKFKYYPGWFPKAPKELEEMIFEAGEGSYLKGLLSKSFLGKMLHRSLTYYIQNKFEGRTHSAMVLPLKFMGSFNIDNQREYTYSGEFQFDKFITSIEYKKHMDPIYASAEALRMFLDQSRDNNNQPMYANTVKMFEKKIISDVLGRTIRPKLSRKPLRMFGTQYEDRELRADAILTLMRNWTSATLMWLKPFTGGGNGLHASLLQHRNALKGTLASMKIFGVDQDAIDYTLKDQLWADREYFASFVKDAAMGNLRENKIWLMLRKLRYLPDNFDYQSSEKYLLSVSNRIISENSLYAFHRVPEEFVSIITMLAQLKHLKHPKTGKSIYECYKVIDVNGQKDVIWDPEVPSRGKLKHGSGENIWYEDMTELTSHEVSKLKKLYEVLQGGYRKEEASALEVYVMGKMFMQLKKYYPRLLLNAVSSKRLESDLGFMKKVADKHDGEDVYTWVARLNEGRFKVLGKFMLTLVMRNAFNRDYRWSKLEPVMKQHVIDAGLTLGMYGVFYAAYLMMFGDDDDDDSLKKWWKMYLMDNFIQQYDPRELAKIGVQSFQPVAFTRSLDAVSSLYTVMGATWDLTVGNREEAFTQRGDLRGWNTFKKSIPLFASYSDFVKRINESSDIARILQIHNIAKYR